MPPSLPSKPTKDVTKISAAWIAQLLACVDYAMTHPGGDNGATIKDNGGSLSVVRPYHNTGATGTGSSDYNGYFTAISSGTGKIKVVYGAFPTNPVAGYVKLGNARLPVAVAEFTVSSAGSIWIYTKNTSGTLSAELRNGGTLPTEVRGEDIREIISYDSAAAITQIWQLGEYVITGKAG